MSSTVEEDFSAIVFGAHGEVDPVGRATLFVDQLVQFPAVLVGRVNQDAGIAYHLLRPCTADIYGTARQMIGALRPTTEPVHLLAPIPRGNHHRNLLRRIAISAIITLHQDFQPDAQPRQVLNRHMTRDTAHALLPIL